MQRLKKQRSLFEVDLKLVREWHPTANGNLTPQNVPIAHPQKLWWICNEGHEWQATIKRRLKHRGCPACEKKAAQAEPKVSLNIEMQKGGGRNESKTVNRPNINLDIDYHSIGKNFRKYRRFKCKAIAVIEVPEAGYWLYAEMRNISKSGFSFETEAEIKTGTRIRVKIERSLISSNAGGYKTYNSIIRWCKILDDDQSISNYGIGAEIT
jgi:hypothetical protein